MPHDIIDNRELYLPRADATMWGREIGEGVFRLSGLTAEEIKLVEEGAG